MEPLNENELNQLLRKWEAPSAPPGLRQRILPPRKSRLSWLLKGSIRIPVPAAIAAAALIALWIHYSRPASRPHVSGTRFGFLQLIPARTATGAGTPRRKSEMKPTRSRLLSGSSFFSVHPCLRSRSVFFGGSAGGNKYHFFYDTFWSRPFRSSGSRGRQSAAKEPFTA